jgi:hypothetical protein
MKEYHILQLAPAAESGSKGLKQEKIRREAAASRLQEIRK